MNLPDIGRRCEANLCGDRDFLPIQCPGCQANFCRHHSSLDAHACPSLTAKTDLIHPPAPKRARCAVATCDKLTMESNIVDTAQPDSERRIIALCPNCSQAFCAVHRHPSDHDCFMIPKATSASQQNPKAHELLAKHFPPNRSGSAVNVKPPKATTDPKKLARLRAVELMKMRHHAIPADPKDKSVSPNDRIHVKIRVNASPPSADKSFWLRKSTSTGRALDLIADQLAINISDTNPASFKKMSPADGEEIVLRNDVLISKQVEDGDLLFLITNAAL